MDGCGRTPRVPGGPYDPRDYTAWLPHAAETTDAAALARADAASRAAIPSPNIWDHPETYELENRGVDPDGLILTAMREVADVTGTRVLDVGCGSGFHLPVFAELAGPDGEVVGVEPHPPLVAAARARVAGLPADPARAPIDVRAGGAQDLPLASASVDIAHARWAYFFGPGCEPGLAELARVLRPGGVAFVIDNDASTSTFGRWFRREHPRYDPAAIERFWRRRGFTQRRIPMRWALPTREDFERVVRIEFSPAVADAFLAEHPGSGVDYAVNLWWARY